MGRESKLPPFCPPVRCFCCLSFSEVLHMDYICLSAAALRLKKTPTTTRKSINTCYSQIRSYLGSKVPAGEVKTKPPVSLSAFTASCLPARGLGCFLFFNYYLFCIYFVLFHLGVPRGGASAAAPSGLCAARGARRSPGCRRVPGARMPPAALLPLSGKRDVRRAPGPALPRPRTGGQPDRFKAGLNAATAG